jgi:hypothetical protein
MTAFKIIPAHTDPVYVKPLPENPDRLVAVFHDNDLVLINQTIGPGMGILEEQDLLLTYAADWGPRDQVANGIYVFEGRIRWSRYECSVEGHIESEPRLEGAWRRITAEEAQHIRDDEYIWDPAQWYVSEQSQQEDENGS